VTARGAPVIRSLLYVPASSDRFIAKAHERGADAIILDLEDAVVPAEKASARMRLAGSVTSVRQRGALVFVRINSEPELLPLDAEAACRAGAVGLFVSKARDPRKLQDLAALLDKIENALGRAPMVLVPMIEDPGAVLDARMNCCSDTSDLRTDHGRRGSRNLAGCRADAGSSPRSQAAGASCGEGRRHALVRLAAHRCRLRRGGGD